VQGTDQTEVSVERWSPADFGMAEQDEWLCSSAQVDNSARWLITVASGHAHPSLQLANLANYLGTKGLSVRRVFLDLLDDPEAAAATAAAAAPGETKLPPDPDNHESSRSVMMLRLFVAKLRQQQPKSSDPAPNTELPPELCDDIRKLKWIDSHAIELAASAGLTFAQAEIIDAYASCVHGPLMKTNKHVFTMDGIRKMLKEPAQLIHAKAIASFFEQRFDPALWGANEAAGEKQRLAHPPRAPLFL
jgi:hypothetical protein